MTKTDWLIAFGGIAALLVCVIVLLGRIVQSIEEIKERLPGRADADDEFENL